VTVVPLAHIAGVPVEESLLPLASGLLLAGAWVMARVRGARSLRDEQHQGADTRSRGTCPQASSRCDGV
jgi:hypothetical protein